MAEEVLCVWDLGDPCDGAVAKVLMFRKQLDVPICHHHLDGHKEIMILHGNGYEIEEVVDMTPEERKRLAHILMLSGLDLSQVEI